VSKSGIILFTAGMGVSSLVTKEKFGESSNHDRADMFETAPGETVLIPFDNFLLYKFDSKKTRISFIRFVLFYFFLF
jgi:hypothetical protein